MLKSFILLGFLASGDALRLPTTGPVTRRTAIALPALFVPHAAMAKYRPSLAEFKGYGGSPILDEQGEPAGVATGLSHAQLVANSVAMQEKQYGRKLSDDEVAEIDVRWPLPLLCHSRFALAC